MCSSLRGYTLKIGEFELVPRTEVLEQPQFHKESLSKKRVKKR
jgi:hypothetical protein